MRDDGNEAGRGLRSTLKLFDVDDSHDAELNWQKMFLESSTPQR